MSINLQSPTGDFVFYVAVADERLVPDSLCDAEALVLRESVLRH